MDKDDEVFWLISEDNSEAKKWLKKLHKLKRIDLNDLTITRVDNIWDGPLAGIAEYNNKEYYFVAIFDQEGPSLSVDVGRCYLLLELSEDLKKGIKRDYDLNYKEPDLDYSNPIGYFGGSLGYFMTHPDKFKKK